MAELLLIVSLLGIFAFGFYIMCRLDRFLEENRKALLKENESREPSEILLPQGPVSYTHLTLPTILRV